MSRRRSDLLLLASVVAALLLAAALSPRPPAAGPEARARDVRDAALLAVAGAVLLAGATAGLLPPERAGGRSRPRAFVLPLAAGVGLAAPLLVPGFGRAAGEAEPLEVAVLARQFVWRFHHPGPDGRLGRLGRLPAGFVRPGPSPLRLDPADPAGADDVLSLDGRLRLPAERDVVLRLRSQDVLHALWLPAFRRRADCVPGASRSVRFRTGAPGTSSVLCAAPCGIGHARMRARVVVLPPAEYAAWRAGAAR